MNSHTVKKKKLQANRMNSRLKIKNQNQEKVTQRSKLKKQKLIRITNWPRNQQMQIQNKRKIMKKKIRLKIGSRERMKEALRSLKCHLRVMLLTHNK